MGEIYCEQVRTCELPDSGIIKYTMEAQTVFCDQYSTFDTF